MAILEKGLAKQRDAPLGEPHSALGKAMHDRQSHGVTRTRFVSVPGAPLDHNRAERALKLCIRQRKNALFFQSEPRADIASVLTSLMATCLDAGVNAWESLVA
jgi:transposase